MKGQVVDQDGIGVSFATVVLENTRLGSAADADGRFSFEAPKGTYTLLVTAVGFSSYSARIEIVEDIFKLDKIVLQATNTNLDEVTVLGKTQAQEIRETAYAVNAIETKTIQNRELNMNQLATRTAGIRVRESGGLGSNFNYSLDGMSGNAVRFFVDGIPMDRYGSGYAINNFPVNLVERVEIFKGVVPPRFGSDALGGIINLVTKNKKEEYLDASYSYGSFNTHRAALSTRWVEEKSNFFVDLQGFYNYSDNNYEVWGPGVEVADPNTGRTIEIRAERFHDAYRSASGKLGLGFFDKKWADQIVLSLVYADNYNEIQHGATMAAVYGDATRKDQSLTPYLFYTKKNIFNTKLEANVHSSVSFQESFVNDVSDKTYNWRGEVVDEQPTNSELGRGANGKSLLTLENTNWFQQLNLVYPINDNHSVNVNYTYDHTLREGNDPLASDRTVSFVEPQKLTKQVSSVSYQGKFLDERLENMIWAKNYDYKVSTVDQMYIQDSLGYRPVTSPLSNKTNNFGFGYAVKYQVDEYNIAKFSVEKAYRLPTANETLGDGLLVRPSPELGPEESTNLNFSWFLSQLPIGSRSHLSVEPSVFYRNVSNLIQYRVNGNLGAGASENVSKVRGYGGALDMSYSYTEMFRLKGNVTYQQLKDWNEFVGANPNLTYKDLLPNTPYLMANGEFTFTKSNLFRAQTQFSFFWDVQYVHEFYLNWPSLGNQNKAEIPTQLVNGTGISYSMDSGKYNISAGCQNVFDKQVYDNYLLQKPGRSFYIKLRYFIN